MATTQFPPLAGRFAALVLAAGIAAHAPAVVAQDALPLDRGYYVAVETDCAEASNATLLLFTGEGFNSSTEACEITDLHREDEAFVYEETCTDTVHRASFSRSVTVTVHHPQRFRLHAAHGDAGYRLCPQDELPEPWRSNDLTDLLD